jgi:N-acetylglutamate synthase-like GNAT family acetyltransferase
LRYTMGKTDIEISTVKEKLDIDYIQELLTHSYWAEGITKRAVSKSIDNSFCFGVYKGRKQVGFARVITDFTTFAYLADVFIDRNERGLGLGKLLIETIITHKELSGLRRWHLLTSDAHELYQKFGFKNPEDPLVHMEKRAIPVY